jgi:hypothetical protein
LTFHFDADPDPNPTQGFTNVDESGSFLTSLQSSASLHCFIYFFKVIGFIILNIFDNALKFYGTRSLALPLHIVKMDPDPAK